MKQSERVVIVALADDARRAGFTSPHLDQLERIALAGSQPIQSGRKLQSPPLRSQSDKRRAEASKRAQVRIDVLARDGECIPWRRGMPGACEVYPGRAPLEVHEIAARGTHPGSHLDPDLCVATCPRHHDQITDATGDLLVLARKLDLRRRPTT